MTKAIYSDIFCMPECNKITEEQGHYINTHATSIHMYISSPVKMMNICKPQSLLSNPDMFIYVFYVVK